MISYFNSNSIAMSHSVAYVAMYLIVPILINC